VYKPLPSVCPGTEVTRWSFTFEVWSNSELRASLATDAVLLSAGFPGVDGRRIFSTPTPLGRLTEESLPVRYPREKSISLMKNIRVGLLGVGNGYYSLGIAFVYNEF